MNFKHYVSARSKANSSNEGYKQFSRELNQAKGEASKLQEPELMDEEYLLNTIKYQSSSTNQEFQDNWSKRKDLCKMELMKRWTKELQEKGIKDKIAEQTVDKDDLYKNFPNRNQIMDMILK